MHPESTPTKAWLDAKLAQISAVSPAQSYPLEQLQEAQEKMRELELQFVRIYGGELSCCIFEPRRPWWESNDQPWSIAVGYRIFSYNTMAVTYETDTPAEPTTDWDIKALKKALTAAAYHYKRECGLDFAPEVTGGLWVVRFKVCYARDYPVPALDKAMRIEDGLVVGFAVLQDRDEDGRSETLEHLWVAESERRQGHALAMLHEAKRLGVTEGGRPYTTGGAAVSAKFKQEVAPLEERGDAAP